MSASFDPDSRRRFVEFQLPAPVTPASRLSGSRPWRFAAASPALAVAALTFVFVVGQGERQLAQDPARPGPRPTTRKVPSGNQPAAQATNEGDAAPADSGRPAVPSDDQQEQAR